MSKFKIAGNSVSKTITKKNKTTQSTITSFLKVKNKSIEQNLNIKDDSKIKINPEDTLINNDNNKISEKEDPFFNNNELLKLEKDTIPNDWFKLLSPIFKQKYFLDLKKFINSEYASRIIYPPKEEIYSFTQLTNLDNIKCIIIGQDPYHNEGQAHGLAFSIKNSKLKSLPPSLKNIYKAVRLNYPDIKNLDDTYGNLKNWSNQGVLLTNRLLTVEKNKPLSHKKKGWELFQDQLLINLVNFKIEKKEKFVFMLWGDQAKNTVYKNTKLMTLINKNKDMIKIIENVHPSPLSCNRKIINPVTKEKDFRPWFDKRDFKECNDWLSENGLKIIDWGNK